MNRIAKFKKVSFEQFLKDYADANNLELSGDNAAQNIIKIQDIYNTLKLPKRATTGSAGYDFYAPEDITLEPGETIKIPTGIRAKMNEGWVLMLFPRSGLGFKFRMQLNNTVGIIDEDYFFSDNEGHIFAKITNDTNEQKVINVKAGDGFIQGIYVPFGVTEDDDADGVRNGGMGSTTGV